MKTWDGPGSQSLSGTGSLLALCFRKSVLPRPKLLCFFAPPGPSLSILCQFMGGVEVVGVWLSSVSQCRPPWWQGLDGPGVRQGVRLSASRALGARQHSLPASSPGAAPDSC